MAGDPRDSYTLFVWPTKGPLVGVKLDMSRVRAARAAGSHEAEVDEVIRQLSADARLRGVNLQQNRALLVEMMKYWVGRIVRVEGMVYPAPGATPDPTAEMNQRIKQIEETWRRKLEQQQTDAERDKQVALKRRDEIHARETTALRERYKTVLSDALSQRDSAIHLMELARTAQAEAETRARIAEQSSAAAGATSEEAIAAKSRADALELQVRTLMGQVRTLNDELNMAAQDRLDLDKWREKAEYLEQSQRQDAASTPSSAPSPVEAEEAEYDRSRMRKKTVL